MSSAFIYGGRDKVCLPWADLQSAGFKRSEPQTLSVTAKPHLTANPAYVYGGIDREPVEWRTENEPSDFSIE